MILINKIDFILCTLVFGMVFAAFFTNCIFYKLIMIDTNDIAFILDIFT